MPTDWNTSNWCDTGFNTSFSWFLRASLHNKCFDIYTKKKLREKSVHLHPLCHFFPIVVKPEISHPTVRKTRLSPQGHQHCTSLVNMMEEKKKEKKLAAWRDIVWKGKACGWRTSEVSQWIFSLGDESSPLCVKLKVDIAPLVRNLLAPIPHPYIPTTLSISPVTSGHSLELEPTFIKSKARAFKTNHFIEDLGIFFHGQKVWKVFFFFPWHCGVGSNSLY